MACVNQLPIEEFQNRKNKVTASTRSSLLERKIHKFKKMLRLLLKYRRVVKDECPPPSTESIQNDVNEALEKRLKEDLSASVGVRGDAIHAIVDGTITLISVPPSGQNVSLPVHFVCTTPGQFSWTFQPAPDTDICSRGYSTDITGSQSPQQQTPASVTY